MVHFWFYYQQGPCRTLARRFRKQIYQSGQPKYMPKKFKINTYKSASVLKINFHASDEFKQLLKWSENFKISPYLNLLKENMKVSSLRPFSFSIDLLFCYALIPWACTWYFKLKLSLKMQTFLGRGEGSSPWPHRAYSRK